MRELILDYGVQVMLFIAFLALLNLLRVAYIIWKEKSENTKWHAVNMLHPATKNNVLIPIDPSLAEYVKRESQNK